MRKSWTDERLDDFGSHIDQRFDRVDVELHRVNDRLDGVQRTMVHAALATSASIVGSSAALAGLILTQL